MAKHDRHQLGAGIAIQRRGRVWWLDIYRDRKRLRKSLKTQDEGEALMIASTIRRDIELRTAKIEALSLFADLPADQADRVLREMFRDGCYVFHQPPPKNWAVSQLTEVALDSTRVEDVMRKAVREEVAEALDQRRPAPPAAIAWNDALQKFEKSKTGKVVPNTLKNLLRDTQEFIDYAKVPHIGDATSALVDEWVSDLQAGGSSAKTAKNKRLSLSSFFRWAVRTARIIEKNPVSNTEPPKVVEKDPVFLTRDQFAQRMERIKGKSWEWVAGLSAMGLRLSEIRRLDPGRDIDIPGRTIRVRNTDEGATKTGLQRNVVILDQALRYVMMVPKDGFRWKSDKEISTATCAMGVGNLLLRHTLETHLRLNGVLPQAVGDSWLGHDGRTGSKHYAGWWRPSEPPMKLTYFGLPLVPHGIPEVSAEVRKAYKA